MLMLTLTLKLFISEHFKTVRTLHTMLRTTVVPTKPIAGQKPGTSGLRKKVKEFKSPNYTENFVQCILSSLGDKLRGSTLIVGGDGRYYCREAVEVILRICAGNEVRKVVVGKDGLLSTPAVSCLIRNRKVLGGIILTASHNPGGPENDFGIKYNIENGGPAPDGLTSTIYNLTETITEYRICPELKCDICSIGTCEFKVDGRDFTVEIVDPTEDYVKLMKSIFDFPKLKSLLHGSEARKPFRILMDAMNGVTGVYVKKIFVDELGAAEDNVYRVVPLEDFGGIHPDPNLTYAADLVDRIRRDDSYELGAAFDGDGDRNMVVGRRAFFVTPSDSLAVIANNLCAIPYFRKHGVRGFARSMPTAGAVDRVARKLGKESFETPTGWKYFGNLMDADRLSLCGEESFGTGSNHIREKDGIWTVLAWLSILEARGATVEATIREHWREFGRDYFTRYDYEECDAEKAERMMAYLQDAIIYKTLIGWKCSVLGKTYVVKACDDFSYVDPIDHSEARNQGVRVTFEDDSRIVIRLSGTGSSGATVRLYFESYEKDNYEKDVADELTPLINVGLQITKLQEFTGRAKPTVIT